MNEAETEIDTHICVYMCVQVGRQVYLILIVYRFHICELLAHYNLFVALKSIRINIHITFVVIHGNAQGDHKFESSNTDVSCSFSSDTVDSSFHNLCYAPF